MTSFDNFQVSAVLGLFGFIDIWLKPRPTVISQRRNVCQATEYIDFRQCQRRLPDALGLGGDGRTQLSKQPPLDFDNLFLGVQNLRLILFQLWSCETLGIHQRLLTLVVGGREVQVRLGNLDVVTENGIELYLERPNPSPLSFTRLYPREILLRVAAQVAQFVEIMVDARSDHAAIAQRERRLWNQRAVDPLPQIVEFVDRDMQRGQ